MDNNYRPSHFSFIIYNDIKLLLRLSLLLEILSSFPLPHTRTVLAHLDTSALLQLLVHFLTFAFRLKLIFINSLSRWPT